MTGTWLDRTDPLGGVHVMAGLSNWWRRVMANGHAPPRGFVLLGDSALYTNPAQDQGASLSCWMAQRLTNDLERATHDPVGVTAGHEAWVERQLVPNTPSLPTGTTKRSSATPSRPARWSARRRYSSARRCRALTAGPVAARPWPDRRRPPRESGW